MSFKEIFKQKYNSEDLLQQFKSQTQNKYFDERFWKPAIDPKTGQGGAVIRFLPSSKCEEAFVKIYEFSFQGPTGRWYIQKCLNTIGLPDPVSEYNSEQWATGDEALQNEVRKRKRKTSYITNIYVVRDPAQPENEGKVFLFKFGKKIFNKLEQALNPPNDGIEEIQPLDPFDLFEGANFILRIKKGDGGFPNYDESRFDSKRGPLFEDEEKLEKIYNSTYDLREFLDPKTFKSYDELKQLFRSVMGLDSSSSKTSSETVRQVVSVPEDEDDEDDIKSVLEKLKGKRTTSSVKKSSASSKPSAQIDDDDDDDIDELLKKVGKIKDDDEELGDDVPF